MVETLKVKADIAGDDSTLVPDQGYVNVVKQKCAQSAFITYHGLVDDRKRIQLLKDAKVLVCFKDAGFEEIFGLVLVEALACGTPVVSISTWGAENIIVNGKNGFMEETPEKVSERVKSIVDGTVKLDPQFCRKTAEAFSRERCSKEYESLLKSVVGGSRW
jgi:glycosyltransferase involved in cell wall biosynthesis